MAMLDACKFNESETLESGVVATNRAVRSDDRQGIIEAFKKLERESIVMRFFGYKDHLSKDDLNAATQVDFERVVGLVVTIVDGDREIIIGSGGYSLLNRPPTMPQRAEVSFIVEEDANSHRKCIASRLLKHLANIARERNVKEFVAEVLFKNRAMLTVFKQSGLPMHEKTEDRVIHVTLSLDPVWSQNSSAVKVRRH